MIYESERAVYRLIEARDQAFYESLYTSSRLMRYIGINVTPEQAHLFFNSALKQKSKNQPTYLAFMICSKSTGANLGIMGVTNINYLESWCEIGIILDSAAQGKGYPLECTMATLHFVFETLNIGKVVVGFDRRNTPILKLVKKIGFQQEQEAHLKSHSKSSVFYSISRKTP
jgi:ribosomal-protein-alanine N-acetyltransferase